jgi:hypothetical protein
LHAAVANSDIETVLLLLDRGGNPYSPNEMGFTAIDLACSSGNEKMARLLKHRAEDRESSTWPDATLAKRRLSGHFHSQGVPQGELPDPAKFYLEYDPENCAFGQKFIPEFIRDVKTQMDCHGTQQPTSHGNSEVNEEVSSKWGHWPNGESGEVREALAANTQRLESLAFPQANFTTSCSNCLQSSERCGSPQHEEWIVVERDEVETEMS